MVGSGISAVAAWAAQAVVARLVGPGAFAEFMSVWGIVFFLVAMLQGVQQEVVRSLNAGEERPPDASTSLSVARIGAGAVVALLAWLALSAVAGSAVSGTPLLIGAALTLAIPVLIAHQVFNGALAGSHMWGYYAVSLSAEALGRAMVVVAVIVVGSAVLGQTLAVVLGGTAWTALLLSPRVRHALARVRTLHLDAVVRNAGGALVATASGALVINAFPVLLQVAGDVQGEAGAGVVIAAVVLTRAPLLMPLYAVQGLVIGIFTRAPAVLPALTRVVAATAVVTAVGSGLAALVGPMLVTLLFGSAYAVSGGFLAALVAAAGLTAMLTLGGWAALARGRTTSYAVGWATAPVAMVLLLMVPTELTVRSVVALAVAPVVGSLVMALMAQAEGRRRRA